MAINGKRPSTYQIAFIVCLSVTIMVVCLYVYNIFRWSGIPDFGFGFRTATGIDVVGVLKERGRISGLRVGDRILMVNDRTVDSYLGLQRARNWKIGQDNVYSIEREGIRLYINIPNLPLGMKKVIQGSGFTFILGLVFIIIGTLVYLMKPNQRTSWVFLNFGIIFGLFLIFLYQTNYLSPLWVENFPIFAYTFTPTSFIHLALSFPKERKVLTRLPYIQVLPYIVSLVLFLGIRTGTPTMTDAPKVWLILTVAYMALGVFYFIGSTIQLWLFSQSAIVKLRAKMVLLGFAIAASVPLIDFVINATFKIYLVPSFNYYLPFFIVFPAFVGYSIVKHDLFDIDTIIKRTYGYVLTTGTLAGFYGLFVLISNVVFGRFEITRSKMFPLIFMLAVVFFFNPIRNRVQRIIDRLFYRLEYDYQETVQKISETMRSLLKLDEIGKSIMDTALGAMFIDCGCVMLMNQKQENYQCLSFAGECAMPDGGGIQSAVAMEDGQVIDGSNNVLAKAEISSEDPLVKKISERKKEVTIYDVQEDPFYEDDREAYAQTFEKLQATLIIPLIYEDQLIGLISLGRKKSGKFYRREDVNLLNILANQGAVAIENALMIEEVIEKERMEEELNIAKDLQVSMLPAENPEIAGLEIASYSASAREVGGDFYDFIAMGEEKVGMLIGDVTGKSVSGALVMSASRSIFRMLSEEDRTVADIMIRANQRTKKDIITGMFVALLYAVVNAKERTVDLCSAGQTQPIHLAADTGDVHLVETEGDTFPLGILEDVEYVDTHVTLKPGDTVVFYTDGIVEAMNPAEELYGFDRLEGVIQNSSDLSAQELLDKILDQVNTFAAGADQHDDITVIIIKMLS